MSSSVPLQIAETLQTAHLKRDPSPQHDLNPSTAADRREPVELEPVFTDEGIDVEEDEDGEEEEDYEDSELYRSRIKPRPRRHHQQPLPPMPDLRFEQSYLHSIRNADTWWKVGWITVRDQVRTNKTLHTAGPNPQPLAPFLPSASCMRVLRFNSELEYGGLTPWFPYIRFAGK